MISHLQNLKQVAAQCRKLRSWLWKLPPELSDELHIQLDDIEAAVKAALKEA